MHGRGLINNGWGLGMRYHGYCTWALFGISVPSLKMTSHASLRVERHPRGHIASCNGRVELLNTRVVSCTDPSRKATEKALLMDVLARREKERKAQELENFQKRVKHRVSQREREKQQEIAHKSTELAQSEQRAAEKAVKLDKIKVESKKIISKDQGIAQDY